MPTEKFLRLLDPESDTFCFLAYPESPGKNGGEFQQHGTLQEFADLLWERNEAGYGISVCINETDGKGRKRENIVRIRAVWQDDDHGFEGDFPLEPSLIVETSPGRFHRYWFIADDWPADEKGRTYFQAVMTMMVENYGSDKQASDLSRVLRLPGFNHVKTEPRMVEIKGGSGKRYTREEIVGCFLHEWPNDQGEETTISPAMPMQVEDEEISDETIEYELDRISDALSYIEPEDRENWLAVGMALHHHTDGAQDAYEIWDEWSKGTKAKNYKEADQKRAWARFSENHPNPKTIASIYQLARKSGWSDIPPLAQLAAQPIEIPRRDNDLVFRTIADVKQEFEQYPHRPSAQHYEGLEQMAAVIQAMAEGNPVLQRNYHISFLPPGTGKTTTVTAAIRNLVHAEEYKDVGVIIFLFRVEEIRKLVETMGLSEQDFSVVVSDSYKEGELGNPNKTAARVLFTTQQMLESCSRRHDAFEAISEFHWNGLPRQVRIWDEAILPAEPVTLNYYGISGLLKTAAHDGGAKFASDLEAIFNQLRKANDKQIIQIPDIREHGFKLSDMRSWYDSNDDKQCCEALFRLSGKEVRVRKDLGNTALSYENFLPDDLDPMLVLDASGQFRTVYEFWQQSRGDLIALSSPQKNYNGLTIHHWDRGIGRKARKDDGGTFIEGAVKTITAIPRDQQILVIYHKPKSKYEPQWEQEIRSRLPQSDNVHFCNWGRHTATNDYHECRHTILLGVLQYATSGYEAIARGAKGLHVKEDLGSTDLRTTRLGEIAHNIFQAACRGTVRKSEGDGCPPDCHLYVIFSDHAGVGIPQELLGQIFPGATIKDWRPVIKPTGRVKELWDLLQGMPPGPMEKEDLRQKLGMNYVQQLNKLLAHPELLGIIEQEGGWIEDGRGTVTHHRAPESKLDLDKLLPF